MVKMIPKIWKENKTFQVNIPKPTRFVFCKIVLNVAIITDLSWAVQQSRGGSLWLWICELYCKLKAQRKISRHEEAADTHANTESQIKRQTKVFYLHLKRRPRTHCGILINPVWVSEMKADKELLWEAVMDLISLTKIAIIVKTNHVDWGTSGALILLWQSSRNAKKPELQTECFEGISALEEFRLQSC